MLRTFRLLSIAVTALACSSKNPEVVPVWSRPETNEAVMLQDSEGCFDGALRRMQMISTFTTAPAYEACMRDKGYRLVPAVWVNASPEDQRRPINSSECLKRTSARDQFKLNDQGRSPYVIAGRVSRSDPNSPFRRCMAREGYKLVMADTGTAPEP